MARWRARRCRAWPATAPGTSAPATRPAAVPRSVGARRGGDWADCGHRQAARVLRGLDGLCRGLRSRCFGRETGRPIGFAHSNDPVAALWTGLRAALAVFLVSSFWILTNWAYGSTAAVLGAVATARLATMAPAVPVAVGATLIFALATIPAFIIAAVLLPLADGFGMFAVAVAPMLFLCAFLMGHKKTMLIGYMSALLFASAGQFLDQMVYDPVGLLNTCIAAVVSAATALVLWATVAPATPEAARRRF
ncbi:MAG: FUSC family protein, partial [Stellaceae bacterium]